MEAIVIRNNLAYRQDGGQVESGERIKEGVGWRNGVVGRRDGRNEKDAAGGRKVWRRTLAIAGNSFWIAGPSSDGAVSGCRGVGTSPHYHFKAG